MDAFNSQVVNVNIYLLCTVLRAQYLHSADAVTGIIILSVQSVPEM